MRMLSFISCLSLAAMSQITPAPAQAAGDDDRPIEVHVAYNDLDLLSPPGEKTLMHRIDHAVRQVCAPFDSLTVDRSAYSNCRKSAMRRAYAQMDRVVVAARSARTGYAVARQSTK